MGCDSTSSTLLIHLSISAGPAVSNLTESGCEDVVTYDAHIVLGQVQVDRDLSTAWFVSLKERINQLLSGTTCRNAKEDRRIREESQAARSVVT